MALPGRGGSHSSPPGGINTPRSEEVFKINGSLRAVLSPPCPPGSRQEGTARSESSWALFRARVTDVDLCMTLTNIS